MKIDHLQRYIGHLAILLDASDGKKAATGLREVVEALEEFQDMEIPAFAQFLKTAAEYKRTGVVPITATKAAGRGKAAAPKESANPAAIRADIQKLYHDASNPATTIEMIEAVHEKLKPLKKPDLVAVAEAIGLVGMNKKTMPEITKTIVDRIRNIKQAALRTSIID